MHARCPSSAALRRRTKWAVGAVLAVLAVLGAGTASASASTLYVAQSNSNCTDAGSGTSAQPYCTIGAAAADVTAGQTVQVSGGTYDERVSLARSGTAAAPINFVAVPGETVTVANAKNGFYTNGKAYVTIEGFRVTGTSEDAIVVSKSSSHITVRGNDVSDAGQPVSGLTARGIRVDITNDNVIAGNTVHDNSDYGIYVVGGSTRNLVTGNEVYGNARVFQRAASGIRIHSSAGNTVSGNYSHDNEDSGIELVTGSQNNLVIDNVVVDNGDHGIDDTGQSPNNSIIGNTVVGSGTAGIDFEGSATGSIAYNNIAVDNGINSPRTSGNIRVDSDSTMGTVLDYNLVWLTVPGQRNYTYGVGYDTLAEMQAATGQEMHSIQADPKFVSPATRDFRLQRHSPAIDSANSGIAGAPTTDADGNARIDDPATADTGVGPRSFDDRGAYEFQPRDIAPSAALSVSPGSGAIDLGVTADASSSVDDDGLSPIESYRFDWGDGSSTGPQAAPTATHDYTLPGTYTVTVTVTDTAGLSSTATSDVTVRDDPPDAAVSATPSSGSGPLEVTADASGSSDIDATPIESYRFDWGDGSGDTGEQGTPAATHTYADPGDYVLTVWVTDTAGNTSQATTTVRVFGSNLPPDAELSVSPASGVVDLDVTADASASSDPDDGVAGYRFDWGDGTAGTGLQPDAVATHTYRAAGTHTVTVTVEDVAGQTSTAVQTVTVDDRPPDARLSTSPVSGLAPVAVQADASASADTDGTPIASYRFDWGDGSAATGPQASPTATHTYTAGGTYTATVTVKDTAGQASTATTQVFVRSNLVGNPGFESSLTGWNTSGSGTGVTLARVAGGHGGGFSAQLSNGGAAAATCSLNDAPDWARPSVAGRYDFSIWVRGDAAGATIKARVTEFSGSANLGSASSTMTLTTGWQKLSVRYTPAAPGSSLDFNVFIVNAPPGPCFNADDVVIASPANDAPSAALAVSPGSGAIDLGVTADASGSVDDDGLSPIADYSFEWGDGSSATGPQAAPTATHSYTLPGIYTVKVTVRDTIGLTSTATYNLTVRDDPPHAMVSATPSSGSGPLAVTADASGSSDIDATPIASYRFDWGDGSADTGEQGTPTATHTYADPGDYTLTVTVTDTAGNSSQATTTVRVFGANLPPDAELSVSPASGVVDLDVTADASASSDPDDGIAGYRFDWGDGTAGTGLQSTPLATHTYHAAGTYTVSVTVEDTAGQPTTATTQVVVKPNLVGNPGFESSLTGWNTSGSGANVTLARVAGGHSGSWAARLANGGTSAATCSLNDSPDWVRPSVAGSYRYSIWVRGDTAGATIKARVTEYSGSTNLGSATTTATLTTSWQKLTVDYAPTAPGSSLDFMTYITNVKGTCFYADDAAIGGP